MKFITQKGLGNLDHIHIHTSAHYSLECHTYNHINIWRVDLMNIHSTGDRSENWRLKNKIKPVRGLAQNDDNKRPHTEE